MLSEFFFSVKKLVLILIGVLWCSICVNSVISVCFVGVCDG